MIPLASSGWSKLPSVLLGRLTPPSSSLAAGVLSANRADVASLSFAGTWAHMCRFLMVYVGIRHDRVVALAYAEPILLSNVQLWYVLLVLLCRPNFSLAVSTTHARDGSNVCTS